MSMKSSAVTIEDFELDPKEWGEGRFDKINKAREEKRARIEREKQLAEEKEAKIIAATGPTTYKKGTGKFK